jgi:hypothetical protein
MEIYKILIEIIEQPEAIQFYKNLQKYYESQKMTNESDAVLHLIENKFKKANVSNSTDLS